MKPGGPSGLANTDKSTITNILFIIIPFSLLSFVSFRFINIFCFADVFMKVDPTSNYTHDKKMSILDSIPPVLIERFATFDDNKNNNRDQRSVSKEYLQSVKSVAHENGSNVAKCTTSHGNSRNVEIDVKLGFSHSRILRWHF